MDCKVSGSLMHYAVFLIFLGVQWSPVFPAPTSSASISCAGINDTVGLAKLIEYEADKLLNSWIKKCGNMTDSVPPEVPDSQISDLSIADKLQDVCIKNQLFKLHIAQAEKYPKELFRYLHDSDPIVKAFGQIQMRLSHLTEKIQKSIGAEISTLTTPAPLKLSHNTMWRKKVYVWGLAVTLKDWSTKVLEVVKEQQKACDQK